MTILQSTRAFERWLRNQTHVVDADLRAKHAAMADSPFVFLRATFYRWIETWSTVCAEIAAAPKILAVGDLHIENFGTWRDAEGRLVWGINDFDEAYTLPYTNDLVRLATSAVLARRDGQISLGRREICAAILDGYASALQRKGRPIVLAERHSWLAGVAIKQLREPKKFWAALSEGGTTTPSRVVRKHLIGSLPPQSQNVSFLTREKGVGSLGKPRVIAVADAAGARVAREAKALTASAAARLGQDDTGRSYTADLLRRSIRSPDPFLLIVDGWIVRRLAPDCIKIELRDLPGSRDERKLLRAMGWEAGNVHLGSAGPTLLRDLERRPKRWLESAADDMATSTTDDWKAWKKAWQHR